MNLSPHEQRVVRRLLEAVGTRGFDLTGPQSDLLARLQEAEVSPAPSGDALWLPPDNEREPINIHEHARDALRWTLVNQPALRGVGYSAFIMAAVQAYNQGAWALPETHEEAQMRARTQRAEESRT